MLERYVRYLAWYKFNDFQLELNDNGGFRLNSPAFPGLAAKDGSYTEDQFRELESYALVRGITITPEIDSPGHAGALTGYRPDLASPKNAAFIGNLSFGPYQHADNPDELRRQMAQRIRDEQGGGE